jgi:hypothetical protein
MARDALNYFATGAIRQKHVSALYVELATGATSRRGGIWQESIMQD